MTSFWIQRPRLRSRSSTVYWLWLSRCRTMLPLPLVPDSKVINMVAELASTTTRHRCKFSSKRLRSWWFKTSFVKIRLFSHWFWWNCCRISRNVGGWNDHSLVCRNSGCCNVKAGSGNQRLWFDATHAFDPTVQQSWLHCLIQLYIKPLFMRMKKIDISIRGLQYMIDKTWPSPSKRQLTNN